MWLTRNRRLMKNKSDVTHTYEMIGSLIFTRTTIDYNSWPSHVRRRISFSIATAWYIIRWRSYNHSHQLVGNGSCLFHHIPSITLATPTLLFLSSLDYLMKQSWLLASFIDFSHEFTIVISSLWERERERHEKGQINYSTTKRGRWLREYLSRYEIE